MPYFTTVFGNAHSRSHGYGWLAEDAVSEARMAIAKEFDVFPEEILFTSGATESINLAIKGLVYGSHGLDRIISSPVEHKAVLEALEAVADEVDVEMVGVNAEGIIDYAALKSLATSNALKVFMLVNNETGVITDIAQIGSEDGLLFVDATQAAGKMTIKPKQHGVNLMAFSGHKMYGPKGVGVLFIDLETQKRMKPLIHGGHQERGLRSGTLNVPGIVGLAKALEVSALRRDQDEAQIDKLRDYFEAELTIAVPGIVVNGNTQGRIYSTSNIHIEGIDSEEFMNIVGGRVAISNGSACTSATVEPSHVLMSMGFTHERAMASLRFSFGRANTRAQVDQALDIIKPAIQQLRTVAKTS